MAARHALLLGAVLGSVALLVVPPRRPPQPPGSRELLQGLHYRELAVDPPEPGASFDLVELRIDPRRLSVKVLDARLARRASMTARDFTASFDALAVVNGGFFLEDLTPLGLMVCDGVVRNPLRKADWGVFFLAGGKPRIVHTRDFDPSSRVEQALQSGPRLVVSGEPVRLKPQSARRSVIGIDADGEVHIAVCRRGEALAADLAEVARRPVARGGLGLQYALNLDGGPSTQLYAHVGEFELDVPGAWGVPSAIGVHPRERRKG